MRADLLDLVLLVAALLFAVSGYRQGFVVGVLSFVGFLGGGVLGAHYAPAVARSATFHALPRALVGLGVVFLAATLGQLVATVVGGALRARLTWRPARFVDAVAGAAVSTASVLLVAWLVGTAVASSPFPVLASQVRRSVVITSVDGVVPPGGKRFFQGFRRLVDEPGFPQVFNGLTATRLGPVEPPDPRLRGSAVVAAVRSRVLKVTGVAPSCSRTIEGSGFLYAPQRLMTNAHVVAGVRDPQVEVGPGRRLAATVVLFDPGRDVAVLFVRGLPGTPLAFATGPAAPGSDALVVGYPQNGPYRADAARISGRQRARGLDIYGQQSVERGIYALVGQVQPGNSGGPLLAPDGRVYGVVFAAAADKPDVGYALTAQEVASDAATARTATQPHSTRGCD